MLDFIGPRGVKCFNKSCIFIYSMKINSSNKVFENQIKGNSMSFSLDGSI